MDSDTFEELMGVHDAGPDDVEVYVSNPRDPSTFDTVPYSPTASPGGGPVASSSSSGSMGGSVDVSALDARIAELQCSG
jgi:hypothetical protein